MITENGQIWGFHKEAQSTQYNWSLGVKGVRELDMHSHLPISKRNGADSNLYLNQSNVADFNGVTAHSL